MISKVSLIEYLAADGFHAINAESKAYECLSRSDLKQARKMIDEIKSVLGEDDPEVIGAETSLDLEATV